ncbi:putative ABC transport system ATP-binding protein/macrolide transport system ATP-binding/permease protein [Thermosporothrix hazakensis]|jgi:ABC-type lipoprotein export system ATPase subunit|uniref:ABC transporter ATP-binding protein n=2 Tax=Thermosporothrix TaxID=768650 RepID=A0A455SD16_9CHLR|nr:ABC transporter ATP-binding protein [Thermosporothrix hazakensis]PZW28466.1 putative ABC transport system ATP-binding protein/macrolide transport system ATP-binding/permease protein [Thermosporothrix hazakensis]BBH86343.1 ABC transporter ATP-binding protein [Thermosporothrix sp. COM3]GCE45243.1 ABC transporter ATP-binding protein [Thermosporothrix hazakensis]
MSETINLETPTQTTEPAVTVVARNLCKYFKMHGEVIHAVDNASFVFKAGQFVTIMGPSGSGKSTLLYLLGGLDQPTSGELTIDGIDMTRLSGSKEHHFRRQKIGFVFQSFHLIPNLTALENVMLPMELAGTRSRSEMRERARTLLLQVGINEDRHRHRPGKLSGGQKQRIAIARALANDPRVILADEPTGNLDTHNGKRIIDLLRQLAHQGRTVIVVTHDQRIAKQADVCIEIEDGKITTQNLEVPATPEPPQKKKRRR